MSNFDIVGTRSNFCISQKVLDICNVLFREINGWQKEEQIEDLNQLLLCPITILKIKNIKS
jgi:hypothetical protein